jgi:hypothetical protein
MTLASGDSAYTAPEILNGSQEQACRADQYSLGMMALALFTGAPRSSIDGLEMALGRTAAARWLPCLPTLLAPDPASRFPDMAALLAALDASRGQRPRFGLRRRRSGAPRHDQARWSPRRLLVAAGAAAAGIALWQGLAARRQTSEWNDHWRVQIDQARNDLHSLDNERLGVMTAVAAHPEWNHRLVQQPEMHREFDIAADLDAAVGAVEAGRTEVAVARLSHARDAIDERRLSLQAARTAADDASRLETLERSAWAMPAHLDLPAPLLPATLKASRETARTHFVAGEFRMAAAVATGAADLATRALAQLLDRTRDTADAARAQWQDTLRHCGRFPPLDPITQPADRLDAGVAALATGDHAGAVRAFTEARDIYLAWTDELTEACRGQSAPAATASGGPSHPAVFSNSLGMRFVPAGELLASVWETRVLDFMAFVEETGADAGRKWREFASATRQYAVTSQGQGPCHPVVYISPADADRFCHWLTARDLAAGLIRANQAYRLPTDLEWSLLAGIRDDPGKAPRQRSLDHRDHFPWGPTPVRDATSGNYDTWPNRDVFLDPEPRKEQDPFLQTAPVGRFRPNDLGLFDLGGNVWEWTSSPMIDIPQGHAANAIRGGGWRTMSLDSMRTSFRDGMYQPREEIGFRVVLAPVPSAAGAAPDPPQPSK